MWGYGGVGMYVGVWGLGCGGEVCVGMCVFFNFFYKWSVSATQWVVRMQKSIDFNLLFFTTFCQEAQT